VALLLLSSCKNSKKITEESPQAEETKVESLENKMIKAVMMDYSNKAEGCDFLILLEENNELLQFVEIKDDFKVDGKEIWIQFSRSRRPQGPCPLGTPIIIEDIKARN
jgi:hypothetical protein